LPSYLDTSLAEAFERTHGCRCARLAQMKGVSRSIGKRPTSGNKNKPSGEDHE